jgi:phage shock protein PspC (stress-responsive transcriptional regulator)
MDKLTKKDKELFKARIKALYKGTGHIRKGKGLVAGVAKGIASYFEINPIFIRLAFIVASSFYGAGFFIYAILALVLKQGPGTNQPMPFTKGAAGSSQLSHADDTKTVKRLFCGYCHTELKAASTFCHRCGKKLNLQPLLPEEVSEPENLEAEILSGNPES